MFIPQRYTEGFRYLFSDLLHSVFPCVFSAQLCGIARCEFFHAPLHLRVLNYFSFSCCLAEAGFTTLRVRSNNNPCLNYRSKSEQENEIKSYLKLYE